jgi:hypothetical protein
VRASKPGGVIGTVNWTPTGFVGEMLKTVSAHVPPPPGAQPSTRWGTEAHQAELLGDRMSRLACTTAAIAQRFLSSEQFPDLFIQNCGPTLKAAAALDNADSEAFRSDLIALAEPFKRADDSPWCAIGNTSLRGRRRPERKGGNATTHT